MTKLFGTDGVRGIVNKDLNTDITVKLGASVAHILKKEYKKDKLTFFLGTDTRISKDMLKSGVISGFLSEGCDIIDLDIIPTPAISYLITKYKVDGGFVISASHNPVVYNGIKVFNSLGYKLDDKIEDKIENYLFNDFKLNDKENYVGTLTCKDLKKDYVNYLLSTVKNKNIPFKVVIDVANGAAYKTAEMIFSNLKVDYKIINNKIDGYNINENAGSTHMEGLIKEVLNGKYDLGIAYDGDADRCLLVDSDGEIVDGDYILAIMSHYLKEDVIVGTVMSNLGLNKFCEENNKTFIATNVGDKYVLLDLINKNNILGGEQSGHIIFRNYLNTGCGELTSLQILNAMTDANKSLKELKSIMKKYPQVLVNIDATKEEKDKLNSDNIKELIDKYEKKLNGNGRILVRASGTENLIRIMLEGDKDIIEKYVNNLKDELKLAIK